MQRELLPANTSVFDSAEIRQPECASSHHNQPRDSRVTHREGMAAPAGPCRCSALHPLGTMLRPPAGPPSCSITVKPLVELPSTLCAIQGTADWKHHSHLLALLRLKVEVLGLVRGKREQKCMCERRAEE